MNNKKILYFAGGGVHFFWSAGAAKYISEHCCLDNVQIIGSSAGALTAVLLLSGSSFELSADLAHARMVENNVYENKLGLLGLWGSIVENWLNDLIPNDICVSNYANLHVLVTPSCVWYPSELLSNFESKKDVVEACLTSVHLPWFMNGSFSRRYKGRSYIDGCIRLWFGGDVPLPKCDQPDVHFHEDEVWTVDYKEDIEFVGEISGSHETIGLESALRMIQAGFSFMRKKHAEESLPWATSKLNIDRVFSGKSDERCD